MANYVWNKVICSKETLEKYFIDSDPFGEGTILKRPYISLNKLFGVKSLDEYATKIGVHIYYGFGFSWEEQEDGFFEVKFCTKWVYPIKAIIKTLELSHDTVWYAFEENRRYISRFYWKNEVKEDVLFIEKEYYPWSEANMLFEDSLEDPDDGVWHFLPTLNKPWKRWESTDGFKRYLDVAAVHVPFPSEKDLMDSDNSHN